MSSPFRTLKLSLALVLVCNFSSNSTAQTNGRYELLNQDQIIKRLMEDPSNGPTQDRGTSSSNQKNKSDPLPSPGEMFNRQSGSQAVSPSSSNVFIISPGALKDVFSRYDVLIRIPSITISRLTFETNSSRLSEESARSLAKLSGAIRTILKSSPVEVFLIEGHTDFTGSSAANEKLSADRANSVYNYLVYVGQIPANNLTYHGFGSSQLSVKTNRAEVANRRVEIRRITPLLISGSLVPQTLVVGCTKPASSIQSTIVFVGFQDRGEFIKIRELIASLPSISGLDLLDTNAGYSRYAARSVQADCRLAEAIEERVSSDKIKVTILGSIIRIERL